MQSGTEVKKTMQVFTVGCMITYGALLILFCLGTPTEISFSSLNFMTIAFVVLYCVAMGCRNVSSSMAIPMIADCTDYETCKSGFYAPGIIGTIFSFVDKLVSSLATSIVGFPLAVIGYTSALPQPGDSMSSGIFRGSNDHIYRDSLYRMDHQSDRASFL